ncbi:MAG: hypothetical protein O3B73_12205 [bacterium]|nr:hypothetical protein [bacterium]
MLEFGRLQCRRARAPLLTADFLTGSEMRDRNRQQNLTLYPGQDLTVIGRWI